MKIVLTGGGTAGHVMPNIALLPELRKHFKKIYYIGTCGIEKQILENETDVEFVEIEAVKLIRKFTFQNFLLPLKLIKSIRNAKKILKTIRPDIVFSKGGFVSIPTCFAAKKLHIPVVSHESDKSMGLANKLIMRIARKMCISFRETNSSKKCVYTGSPIREQILEGNATNIMTLANFHKNKPFLLFMGGSLGCRTLNRIVYSNLDELCKKYNVLHITGKNEVAEKNNENYYQTPYCNNIQDYFAIANVVICRSGANTLFELLALKKPMLLIPLSKKVSRGDQVENAKTFASYGFADVLEEEKLSFSNLRFKIENILKNKNKYIENMKKYNAPNANKKITSIILKEIGN